ncbi:MAG: nicotinate-nucleotide diphosphorylase (carboxylating), partial [Lentisphaerae bacterium]
MTHRHDVQHTPRLNTEDITGIVRTALAEDIGQGDATTLAVVPPTAQAEAHFRVRENCVICGLPVARQVFRELNPDCEFIMTSTDGDAVTRGTIVATVRGPARDILTGERVALNFLQRLSGIATQTRAYVEALAGSPTRLLDTRKTTPGLRLLEKYAVRCGGGSNHRSGLYD